jgi:hypothetical protein
MWPASIHLRRDATRPCLIVALHPRCPCSRATLDELEEIVQQCGDRLAVHVLFYIPKGSAPEWAHSDLWDRATALAGVQVQTDEGGAEANKFGAATSGCAALYGRDGRLQFCGGITRARGHAGDNDGRRAILAHVLGTATEKMQTDVFGCPICGQSRPDDSTGVRECNDIK